VNPIFLKKSDSAVAAAVTVAERFDPALVQDIEDRVEIICTPPGILAGMMPGTELTFNRLLIDPRLLCVIECRHKRTV